MQALSAAEAAAATAGLIKALEVAGMPENDAPLASIVITTALMVVAQATVSHPAYMSAGLQGLIVSASAAGALYVIDRGTALLKTGVSKVKMPKIHSPIA